MKITVAVPTYRGMSYLEKLIPQLVEQSFYKIYIIDDASPDFDGSKFKDTRIKIITGDKNVGPIANRNRILKEDLGDVLLFCDDDMRLGTRDIPKIIEELFTAHPKMAVLAGLIRDEPGNILSYNFDVELNPWFNPLKNFLAGKPHLPPQDTFDYELKEVMWVLEGFCAVRSRLFCELRGFDEFFKRYNEGPDLCRRLRKLGYKIYITNRLEAVHTRRLSLNRPWQYLLFLKAGLLWHIKYNFIRDKLNK